MKENDQNNLLSRRDFFRKAAKRILPILAVGVLPNMLLTSCDEDNEDLERALNGGGSGCTGCSSGCSSSCSGSCGSSCSSSCKDSASGTASNSSPSTADGSIDGHEYVDLGLSVKWARYNIGASKPESYGSYLYANTLLAYDNWYDRMLDAGLWHNTTTSGTSYDMAISKWGNNWRMPTKDDINELINNCSVAHVKYNGVNGYLFTSKKNGKSIFFPAAGKKYNNNGKYEDDNIGNFGFYSSGDIYI